MLGFSRFAAIANLVKPIFFPIITDGDDFTHFESVFRSLVHTSALSITRYTVILALSMWTELWPSYSLLYYDSSS